MNKIFEYLFYALIVVFVIGSEIWDPFDNSPDVTAMGVAKVVSDNYDFVDQKASKLFPDDKLMIYRANLPVSALAAELANMEQPLKMTETNDDRMLLEYPQGLVDIKAEGQSWDGETTSIVELMTKEYAANNYTRSDFDGGGFLMGYVAADILNDLFNVGKYKYPPYKQDDNSGTGGGGGHSFSGGWFRGGGPGAGK